MSLLIEDLLKYARLGKGRRVKLSPLSLEYPLETALKALAVQIEESGAIISLPDSLPSVIGMDRLLEQVFANLMGNALKYRHDNEKSADFTVLGGPWRKNRDVHKRQWDWNRPPLS